MDLVIKASGLDPSFFNQAKEVCTDGALPEVDASLYGEVNIIDETVEEVQQMQEDAVVEDGRFWCEPEAPGCWAGRGGQVVTFVFIIGAIAAIVYVTIVYGEPVEELSSAMSLLQSEVFNFSMQDYYQKVGMNLALDF